MEHQWEVHDKCDKTGCPICDGGLSVCTVCGLLEGALTTECCGYACYAEKADDIYTGKLDFVGGEWVNKTSPHSPKFSRK